MKSIARSIGKALAYLQDAIDIAMSWFFHRMKKLPKDNGKSHPVKTAFKSVIEFIAGIGDAFYEEYTRLKKNNKK